MCEKITVFTTKSLTKLTLLICQGCRIAPSLVWTPTGNETPWSRGRPPQRRTLRYLSNVFEGFNDVQENFQPLESLIYDDKSLKIAPRTVSVYYHGLKSKKYQTSLKRMGQKEGTPNPFPPLDPRLFRIPAYSLCKSVSSTNDKWRKSIE